MGIGLHFGAHQIGQVNSVRYIGKHRATSQKSATSQGAKLTNSPLSRSSRSRSFESTFQSATTVGIPRASRFRTTRHPINPPPPVTRNFIFRRLSTQDDWD